jgi:hypothetical protein
VAAAPSGGKQSCLGCADVMNGSQTSQIPFLSFEVSESRVQPSVFSLSTPNLLNPDNIYDMMREVMQRFHARFLFHASCTGVGQPEGCRERDSK